MSCARDWFVRLGDPGGEPVFAFPHAGGGCAQLAELARTAEVELWAANLPGRQARLSEPAWTDYPSLATTLATELADRLDGEPYSVLGYCGGALLAYGVLRRLHAGTVPLPRRFVVVSYEAPDIAPRPRRVADLPSDSLWDYLTDIGGVPAGLAADPRLRKVAEPAVRADFTVLAGYRHEVAPPLPLPITVCYGERDGETRRGALLGWRRHTSCPLELHGVPVGHWLLDEACGELAAILGDRTGR
ncbi:thioesterase II family protein [Actinophytocola sp.]|uniref:thioesterase II family protein n=1 Tax=Actinophytocola sp. TaxID=1872138 RepID=UPI00389B353D